MKPTGSRVTLRDIAKALGLNHTTVSRALKDNPRVSTALRKKIKQTAERMGYRPDPMLAALAHYRRGKVEVPVASVLAWINTWPDPKQLRSFKEFDLYWKGAAAEAESAGYRLEEFCLNDSISPARLEQILLTRSIPGILLPPVHRVPLPINLGGLHWEEFCVVRFGYSITEPRAHVVTSDQLTDGLLAYESMWQRGYRRIGLVISALSQTRFGAGFLFNQLKYSPDRQLRPLVLRHDGEQEDQRQLGAWLKKNEPDAILTDVASLRGLLERLGVRVPRDIGLAALSVLDGNADAGIYQNSEQVGEAAAQLLISLIHHNERGIPEVCREVLVEGRWQDGRSLPRR